MGRESNRNLKLRFLFNHVFALRHSRRRKRTRKQVAKKFGVDRRIKTRIHGLDTLPDDILVSILSYLPFEEAAMTSVLSHRWRYLWRSTRVSLEFCGGNLDNDTREEVEKLTSRVNQVLKVYQGAKIDKFIINFETRTHVLDHIYNWVDFVISNDVKMLELKLAAVGFIVYDKCNFPDLKTLLSSSQSQKSPFLSLRILRLAHVNVKEEVVHYFLASCLYLEELCVDGSDTLKNLKITGPLPYFKHLEISNCKQLQSMEISAKNLVTALYAGEVIDVPFKKVHNLTELTLGGMYIQSLLFEPNKHSSYSNRLEKLVLKLLPTESDTPSLYAPRVLPQLHSLKELELEICVFAELGIFFFLLLIKASPLLRRFRMKISMGHPFDSDLGFDIIGYPEVSASDATGFVHEHLKVVEMNGYIGTVRGIKFLLHLVNIAPSLETIVMDPRDIINCDYYYGRNEERAANNLLSARREIDQLREKLPPQIQLDEIK